MWHQMTNKGWYARKPNQPIELKYKSRTQNEARRTNKEAMITNENVKERKKRARIH